MSPTRSSTRTTRARRGATALTASVVAALLLGACSSQDAATSSTAGAAPALASAAAEAAPAAPSAAGAYAGSAAGGPSDGVGGDGDTGKGTVTTTQQGSTAAAQSRQRLIRTAEVTIEVKELAPSAARVRQAALNVGGFVASETTGYSAAAKSVTSLDANGQPVERSAAAGQSVIIMRVPEADLDKAMTSLSGVGKELSRTSSSQDVTGDIADVSSRLATQKASVARVRELLDKATSLRDIVLLESELTKREADLEALQGRLASLSDRADLSTLTVVLQTPEAAPVEPESRNSFVRGLQSGWDAVVNSTTVVLTVLGALLPVAVVLLAVGWPLLALVRRARRRPDAVTVTRLAPAAAPDPAATAPTGTDPALLP